MRAGRWGFVEKVEAGVARAAYANSIVAVSKPGVLTDWNTDVDPWVKTSDQYDAQIEAVLQLTGAESGVAEIVPDGSIYSVQRG